MPKSLSDYPRYDMDLGIACEICGRIAVFDAGQAALYLHARGVGDALPVDTSLFRCRCGSKRVRALAVTVTARPDPLPPGKPRLVPLYVFQRGGG